MQINDDEGSLRNQKIFQAGNLQRRRGTTDPNTVVDQDLLETPINQTGNEQNSMDTPAVVEIAQWRVVWAHRLTNTWYNGAIELITLCFAEYVTMSNVHYEYGSNIKFPVITAIALSLQGFFLLDMVANFVVIGPKVLWTSRKVMYLELLLQVSFIY